MELSTVASEKIGSFVLGFALGWVLSWAMLLRRNLRWIASVLGYGSVVNLLSGAFLSFLIGFNPPSDSGALIAFLERYDDLQRTLVYHALGVAIGFFAWWFVYFSSRLFRTDIYGFLRT